VLIIEISDLECMKLFVLLISLVVSLKHLKSEIAGFLCQPGHGVSPGLLKYSCMSKVTNNKWIY